MAVKAAALEAIQSAPVASTVTVDTSALEAAISKAEGLSKDAYTEASWTAMQEKLTAAKEALTAKRIPGSSKYSSRYFNKSN